MGEHLYNMLNDDCWEEERVVEVRRANCCEYCDYAIQRHFGYSEYSCTKLNKTVRATDVCDHHKY